MSSRLTATTKHASLPGLPRSTPIVPARAGTIGTNRFASVISKLEQIHGGRGPPPRVDSDDDDDDDDDDDFSAGSDDDSDDSEESEEESEESEDDEDDDDNDDDDPDDETRGEQAEEVAPDALRRERKIAERRRVRDDAFVVRPLSAPIGKREVHELNSDDEDEDEEEEGPEYAEDLAPELRQAMAGVWRRCMAQYAVLNLKDIVEGKGESVLDSDCRRRIIAAARRFKEMDAAIKELRTTLLTRLAAEMDPATRRLSRLIFDTMAHTHLTVLPIADMISLNTAENTRVCAVTGAEIVEGGGYFLQFSGAKTESGATKIISVVVAKRAAGAVMAVHFLLRIMKIMNVQAARIVVAEAERAGGGGKVDARALLRTHCLVDAKGVVDAYHKIFMRQLVYVKGIMYKDLALPGLLQRAYDEYERGRTAPAKRSK